MQQLSSRPWYSGEGTMAHDDHPKTSVQISASRAPQDETYTYMSIWRLPQDEFTRLFGENPKTSTCLLGCTCRNFIYKFCSKLRLGSNNESSFSWRAYIPLCPFSSIFILLYICRDITTRQGNSRISTRSLVRHNEFILMVQRVSSLSTAGCTWRWLLTWAMVRPLTSMSCSTNFGVAPARCATLRSVSPAAMIGKSCRNTSSTSHE
jgi:hypothetical protein